MHKKRKNEMETINVDEILYPEMMIFKLKDEIESLKKKLLDKEQQSSHRRKIIEEQSKVIKKLTGINTLLENENKTVNLLKGILENVPEGKITYKSNLEIIEQCLIETNKKFVLLCEGTRKSLDYKIYSKMYPTGLIVPYGSWSKIESILKAYRVKVNWIYAIIDGDKRGKRIKDTLRYEGIFCLNVRATENLMFIDDVFVTILNILQIEKPLEKLNKLKGIALENYLQEEKEYKLNFENILLYYNPKKIMGLVIKNFPENKLSGYQECFINNLNNPNIYEIIKEYIPPVIAMEQ